MIVKTTARKSKPQVQLGIEARRRAMTRALVMLMEYSTDETLELELVPEVGAERPEAHPEEDRDVSTPTEAQVDEAARILLDYTLSGAGGEKTRAVKTRALWGGETKDIDVAEFTARAVVLMADAHPSHLRHVILADPNATLDQVMSHLRVLYGPAASISLTQHGDTDHPHFHAVILTVDPATGKGFQINGGYDIEALHMLAAAIDFENGVIPEPNALYLADDTSIYDRWTGARVASRQFEVDGAAATSIRHNRNKITATNEASDHADEQWLRFRAEAEGLDIPTPEWDDKRVAAEMIVPRIKRAKSWDELHDSLGMIGVRYEQYRGNGRLLLGDDRSMAASSAISTASMTELNRKFGEETFRPPSRPELLRPFIRPRFTMREAEKREAQDRKEAKDAVDKEAARIVEGAQEELQAMQKADRDWILRQIRKVARRAKADHAKRSKLNANRRKAEQEERDYSPKAEEQPEAIAWQLDHERLHRMIDLYTGSGYTRRNYRGGEQWRGRDGTLEFIEYRTFITIMKGADKLHLLRLSQSKWGEDFKITGSRKEVIAYCRLAANHGIMFGDDEQRAMIDGARVGLAKSALTSAGARDRVYERIGLLRDVINQRISEGRRAFGKLVLSRQPIASARKRGAAPVEHDPIPSDRRAMISVQNCADRPDEVIRDYEEPVGRSVPWLQTVLAKHPEDLAAPLLQGWLLATAYRQKAERDIILAMLAEGSATVDDTKGKVVSIKKIPWLGEALNRENDNPEFLEQVFSRNVVTIQSHDPEIQAFVSAREAHPLHDLTIARQELAHRLLVKAGKGKRRSNWFNGLHSDDKLIVRNAISDAPSTSPTFVIDKTLIKNMTPVERALARRQQR